MTQQPVRSLEISDSFPALLDAMEQQAPRKLDGVDLGEIEWVHQVRNELYHQGHGLTVERDKVEVYAQLARALFRALFDDTVDVPEPEGTSSLGNFIACWVSIERTMYRLAELTFPNQQRGRAINFGPIARFLARDKTIDRSVAAEIDHLRQVRNQVIHGMVDHKSTITDALVERMHSVRRALEERLSDIQEDQENSPHPASPVNPLDP